eukprot:TRINITY_DN7898_c0_g2_i1.p1 TRINITY_DN7898_c0_g2~~TRINITY_DN7898_c0_g2_i1.p1  ORF type:complete len:182 (+),score=27.23 TRINITY_DN7898_c0_g2_i1:81-548(+)
MVTRQYLMLPGDMLHVEKGDSAEAEERGTEIEVGPLNGERLGIAVHDDLVITEVVEGSPADQAGLRVGQRVDSVDNIRITHPDQLSNILKLCGSDQTLSITVSHPAAALVPSPSLISVIFTQGQLEGSTRTQIQYEEHHLWMSLMRSVSSSLADA